MRLLISLALFLGLFCSSYAINEPSEGPGSLRLTVIDEATSEPLSYASVSLAQEGEESPSIFGLTNEQGMILFKMIPQGNYKVLVQFMGYKQYEKDIEIKGYVHLGKIALKADTEVLNAASVSAVGNPVIVKKDTIEYTASSFKTSDNAMLEQLLKKLPGVEVAADGSITANGEPVKKITIGGKTFFLDDPKLASRNIPADMVEKVRVVEKRSDQSMFTGIDDGERETVIDLKFRPGMKEGWIGNLAGAGGHDLPQKGTYQGKEALDEGWRWNGSAMTGRFSDKSQISLILNGNNVNTTAFDDMSGSMMQSMRGSIRRMGSGHAGWGGGNGITTSWMGGLNGVFSLVDGRMDLGGNYLYSGSDKQVKERSDKITYLDGGDELFNHNEGANKAFSQGHRFGLRLEHKFSESTSILFEPQFDMGTGHFNEASRFNSSSQKSGVEQELNKGSVNTDGKHKYFNANGSFLFRQRLGKAGRTISASFKYRINKNNLKGSNRSLTSLFVPAESEDDGAWIDQTVINQRYDSSEDKMNFSGRLSYTEPLGRNFYMEANYSYSWTGSESFKDTFDSETGLRDEVYSNKVSQHYQDHQAGLNFSYQKNKFYAQVGATINPTDTKYLTNGQDYSSNIIKWSPRISIRYEHDRSNVFRMYYYGYSSQPSINKIMPVPDISDPLNRNFGNPYLQPYFGHYIRGRYSYTNMKTFTSVNARFGATYMQNPVTDASWYDNAGVRYSLPVNGRDNGSVNAGAMITSPFGKSGFSISSWTSLSYTNSNSYLGNKQMGEETARYFVDQDGNPSENFNYELFHKENPIIDESSLFSFNKIDNMNFVERLRFTYRNDFVELNLGGRTMMSKSWYTLNNDQKPRWNNQVDFNMNWTIPAGVGIVSELQYNWYNGYTNAQKPEFVWNAEISKLLFKNRLSLSIKAYDIFNQSKNLHTSDTANYHQEVWNNTLGRYIMFSIAFRFGKGNEPARGGMKHHPPHPPHRL